MPGISFKHNWMLLGKTSISTPSVTLGLYSLTQEKPGQRTRKDCPCYLVQRSWVDRQSHVLSWIVAPFFLMGLKFDAGFPLLSSGATWDTLSGVLLWNVPSFPCTYSWEGRDSLTMFIWLIHFKTGTQPKFRLLASDFLGYSGILQQTPEKQTSSAWEEARTPTWAGGFLWVSESA